MKKEIAICIQVRSLSKRLKNKWNKKINKKPILQLTFERSKLIGKNYPIYILTSKNKLDDKIELFCKKRKINIFRGDHSNVLNRYINFLKNHYFKTIVRITADNIFTDLYNAKKLIKLHINKKSNYSTNHTDYLPKGMGIDIFESSKLKELEKYNLTKFEKEHINSYFIKNKKKFKTIFYKANSFPTNLSLSIDTLYDYKFIKKNYVVLKKIKSSKQLKNLNLKF